VTLVAAAMKGAAFDAQRLAARAAEGGTTLTELADTLVREHGLPFRTAHSIAALLLKARAEDPNVSLSTALARASKALLGQSIEYSEAHMQQVLSPQYFVDVRKTLGGPAPEETRRALAESRRVLQSDADAWRLRRDHLSRAEQQLRAGAEQL